MSENLNNLPTEVEEAKEPKKVINEDLCYLCDADYDVGQEVRVIDNHTVLMLLSTHDTQEELNSVEEKSGLAQFPKAYVCMDCIPGKEEEPEVEEEDEPNIPPEILREAEALQEDGE